MSVAGTPSRAAANENRPTDREGFYITEEALLQNRDDSGLPLELSKKEIEIERRREGKWLQMLNRWDDWMLQKPSKIKTRCRKGIPASLRGRAWQHLCGANKLMESNIGVFDQLLAQADAIGQDSPLQEFMEIIERDLDRTFPHNERFAERGGEGQIELRRILRAYVIHDQIVGYCQGMGMLVGTLLMQMPTEEAFWCFVAMLDSYVKGYFDSGLKEIQISSATLHSLIGKTNAKLYTHLESQGMVPLLYFTDWFMCAFVKTLPWGAVLRVWDMFFFEGDKIFFRVALAILGQSSNTLLKGCNDQMDMMQYLRNLPPDILFVRTLIPAMLKLPLKRDTIEEFRDRAVAKYNEEHPPAPTPAAPTPAASAPSVNPAEPQPSEPAQLLSPTTTQTNPSATSDTSAEAQPSEAAQQSSPAEAPETKQAFKDSSAVPQPSQAAPETSPAEASETKQATEDTSAEVKPSESAPHTGETDKIMTLPGNESPRSSTTDPNPQGPFIAVASL